MKKAVCGDKDEIVVGEKAIGTNVAFLFSRKVGSESQPFSQK
jgi:hypothetical protein